MRMQLETTAIRVDGAEDTGFQPPFSGGIQQILHRQTAHVHSAVQRLLSNTGHSVSGRVKTRCTQSQSGRRFRLCCCPQVCGLLPQDGQARLPHELVRVLYVLTVRVSHPELFTPSIRVPQASILVTASTSISRRPPASRKDVQPLVGCEQTFQRAGSKPDKHEDGFKPGIL